MRLQAAEALGAIGAEGAEEFLEKFQKDKDLIVRFAPLRNHAPCRLSRRRLHQSRVCSPQIHPLCAPCGGRVRVRSQSCDVALDIVDYWKTDEVDGETDAGAADAKA